MLEPFLEGRTLDEALESKMIFIVNLEILSRLKLDETRKVGHLKSFAVFIGCEYDQPSPHIFPKKAIHHLQYSHNSPCLVPKILHNYFSRYHQSSQEKLKMMLSQNFEGKQGASREMCKWGKAYYVS